MTKDEFLSLPSGMAMRILFDLLGPEAQRRLYEIEKPRVPFAPKYDRAIFRKDGVQYASESNLENLRYWHARAAEGAAKPNSQYAEKDQKQAAELEKWIAWRECSPDAIWSGTRGNDQVTAAPPSGKPMVYQRSGVRQAPPPQDTGGFDDDYPDDGDRIPF